MLETGIRPLWLVRLCGVRTGEKNASAHAYVGVAKSLSHKHVQNPPKFNYRFAGLISKAERIQLRSNGVSSVDSDIASAASLSVSAALLSPTWNRSDI